MTSMVVASKWIVGVSMVNVVVMKTVLTALNSNTKSG